MYATIAGFISSVSNAMYSFLLIVMLLAVGLYFSIRTGFVQFRGLGESIRLIGEKSDDAKSISAFQALMVSTASRVGTGNIVGPTSGAPVIIRLNAAPIFFGGNRLTSFPNTNNSI